MLKKKRFKYFIFKGCIGTDELTIDTPFLYEPVRELPAIHRANFTAIDDDLILAQLQDPSRIIFIEMN